MHLFTSVIKFFLVSTDLSRKPNPFYVDFGLGVDAEIDVVGVDTAAIAMYILWHFQVSMQERQSKYKEALLYV